MSEIRRIKTAEQLAELAALQLGRVLDHDMEAPPGECDVRRLRDLLGIYQAIEEISRGSHASEITVRWVGGTEEAAG